ncbi:MAG: GH12 family glycosyl hydrolase domain-containing protein [Phycicoccus sp.]
MTVRRGVTWKIVSDIRTENATSLQVDVKEFMKDAQARGQLDPNHYLTSVQFGCEIWRGGPGCSVRDFQLSTS